MDMTGITQLYYELYITCQLHVLANTSGIPKNFFFGGGSTNSVEDRGQRERGSGDIAP